MRDEATGWKLRGSALRPRPLWARLLRGGAWTLAGEAAARAAAFLSGVVVARALGSADYGAFVLVQSTAGTLTTLAQFAMGTTVTRQVAAYRSTQPGHVASFIRMSLMFSFATGLLATCLLIATSSWVSETVLRTPSLGHLLALVAPVLLFQALTSTLSGAIAGFEAFDAWARLNWFTSGLGLAILTAAVAAAGLSGAVAALLLVELARFLLSGFALRGTLARADVRPIRGIVREDFGILWRFSVPVFLVSLMNAPVMWLCQTLIVRQGDGLVQLALYDVAQKWMTAVAFVPMAASGAFLPILANIVSATGRSSLSRTIARVALSQASIAAIPAAVVGLHADWAAKPFGAEFANAADVIILAMVLAPIFVAKHIYWQALVSAGRPWATLVIQISWAVIAVMLTLILDEKGAIGLMCAMLVAYAVSVVLSILIVTRSFRGCTGEQR